MISNDEPFAASAHILRPTTTFLSGQRLGPRVTTLSTSQLDLARQSIELYPPKEKCIFQKNFGKINLFNVLSQPFPCAFDVGPYRVLRDSPGFVHFDGI